MAQMRTVALPGNSPVVTLRLVLTTGAAQDPPDKPGLARLTAEMLSGGGTKDLTYDQIVDALFPDGGLGREPGGSGDDDVFRRHARRQPGGVLQAVSAPCCSSRAGARTISSA